MISVCYLSPSRRRRARSRWCWALAPGGCWMWLGREQKTTKTTVWCTAKVSKQHRHPVISPQRNTPHHTTPCHSTTTKTLTILHPLHSCLSLTLSVCLSLRLSFSFFSFSLSCSPCFSKSQMHSNERMHVATRTHKKTCVHTVSRRICFSHPKSNLYH